MPSDFPKTYDFQATERDLYAWWEKNGWFKPTNDPNTPGHDPARKPFVISIPPPNVTGELHLGHAMFVSVEDLLIRYHRLRGEPTLWVPGSDHAGIATQLQVEKDLLRTEEVTREELGREKFLERCWAWKQKYGDIIYDQLRRLGASCDWSRVRFTLDDGLNLAVREAFVRLYRAGLIYRGPRLINWSPGLKTAVSDLEVEYQEEQASLYYFKYRLQDSDEYIPVATTRPETILADTAVAVHPEDERYQRFIGRSVRVPILNRAIPVIADEAVDRAFGTGALKITPGHDFTDYEIGARHGLPILSMLDRAAKVTEVGGRYQGLDRFECRRQLWADMRVADLVLKEEPYLRNTPRSQRGGEIVEPMVSTQWFVKIRPLAEAGTAAVQDGRIRIVPERFEKVYFNWLDPERIKDWCISRQLWWGHRIPVWYRLDADGRVTDEQFCAHTEAEAYALAQAQHGPDVRLEQDPDVLDTWFSSGLWPFSTLGWPKDTPDLRYFYPTSVMETGYDILFFWVARMIMSGLQYTGSAPFHTVYLHGLVRDEQGRKMSKTLGNVIDPRNVMDEFGTDALRFTLLTSGTPGNDLNLSLARVESNRNFANKIWNIARFIATHLPEGFQRAAPQPVSLADRWILARLSQVAADCTRLIDHYEFGQAGTLAYEFLWGDFADWYVEIAKITLQGPDEAEAAKDQVRNLLVHVLDQALRLLHPFVPYITEAVWQKLPRAAADPGALMIARWPEAGEVDQTALADFDYVRDMIRGFRNARAENKLPANEKLPATIVAGDKAALLNSPFVRGLIIALAKLDQQNFTIQADAPTIPFNSASTISFVTGGSAAYIPRGSVDLGLERARLTKELADLDKQIARSEGLLSSDFVSKAPAAVVDKERAKLAQTRDSRAKVQARLSELSA